MKKLTNYKVIEGDSNNLYKNEILVSKDYLNNILSFKVINNNGEIETFTKETKSINKDLQESEIINIIVKEKNDEN